MSSKELAVGLGQRQSSISGLQNGLEKNVNSWPSNSFVAINFENKGGPAAGESRCTRVRVYLASVFTVLLYLTFVVACVLTCFQSVKSVILASTRPVSSTSIKFQSGLYPAPAIVLLYTAEAHRAEKGLGHYSCVCRYTANEGLTDTFIRIIKGQVVQKKRMCNYQTDFVTISDFARVAAERDPSLEGIVDLKPHKLQYVAFVIEGPRDWKMKEQIELACHYPTGPSVASKETRTFEYMVLPSYEDTVQKADTTAMILNHRGSRKSEFVEANVTKVLHTYLVLSEVEEEGERRYLLDTEESYKMTPGDPHSSVVQLKFEWKSPMVWSIKTFIAASPWYAVTVICTMMLTLAEAINVSRKIKIVFMGKKAVEAEEKKRESHLREQEMSHAHRVPAPIRRLSYSTIVDNDAMNLP